MATTNIKFTIKDLGGVVVPSTRFVITSGRPSTGGVPEGIPYQVEFVTNLQGEATVTLEAGVDLPYYISKKDGATEQVIAYKFFVPESSTTLEGELLYVDLGMRNRKYDDASLAALIEAKIVAVNAANNALQIVNVIGGVGSLSAALANIALVGSNVNSITTVAPYVGVIDNVADNLPALLDTAAILAAGGITPQRFGAVGNGSADDTSAMQAFFDSITTYGQRGFIPSGQYNIRAPIVVTLRGPGWTVEGAGVESAIFTVDNSFTASAPAIQLVSDDPEGAAVDFPGFTLGNFSIRAAGSGFDGNATAGLQIGTDSTAIAKATGYQWRNVHDILIANFPVNMKLVHTRMIVFRNLGLYTDETPNTNLLITQNGLSTGDFIFENCQFVNNANLPGNTNVLINSAVGPYDIANGNKSISGINFKSCDLYGGGTAVKLLAQNASWMTDIWFEDGCQIDQAVTYGYTIEANGSGTLIENLHITDGWMNFTGGYGISLAGTGGPGAPGQVKNIWIDKNTFYRNSTAAITTFGFEQSVNNINITDNIFSDCDSVGGAIVLNNIFGANVTGNVARKDGLFLQQPKYLVEIVGTTDSYVVTGNRGIVGQDVETAVVSDTASGTRKVVRGNVGSADAETTVTAADVLYLPAGTGPVGVTVENKLREFVSVKDFGAVGDGSDATTAFSSAAKGVPAAVNIVGAEGLLPRAPSCVVMVPAGQYVLSAMVDTGGRDVMWQLDAAAVITGYNYLNGEVVRVGQRQTDYHHGTTDYACTYSIRSNTDLEDGGEILGITSASELATYGDRDSVSLYVDNTSVPALVDAATASYTATTVTIAVPSASVLKQYRRGMIVDTKHSPVWSGIVNSWNADGSVITVTGWYEFGGAGTPATPPGTSGCVLNGMTKVWAHNANVFLSAAGYASAASGFELGLFNSKGDSSPNYSVLANRCWGYDSVNLGTYTGQAAFIARGNWHHGYYARGQGIGFTAYGNGVAFQAYDASGISTFYVTGEGDVTVGRPTVAGTPVIDFASSGATTDYDARILASGGSATTGQANLYVYANTFRLQNSNGLGYASGSGGQVTQLTSKATGVTLNKICGRIITASDALAAGAAITFSVTNGVVSSTDCVIINASSAAYRCSVVGIAGGSFVVLLENRSSSSLSDAVTLNFAVIKSSTS